MRFPVAVANQENLSSWSHSKFGSEASERLGSIFSLGATVILSFHPGVLITEFIIRLSQLPS